MKAQGGVLTICTWLSVNFGIVTFTSAEKSRGCSDRRCLPQHLTQESNVKGENGSFSGACPMPDKRSGRKSTPFTRLSAPGAALI
jgi:hypothetical protein